MLNNQQTNGLKVRPGQTCIYDLERRAKQEGLDHILFSQREAHRDKILNIIGSILLVGSASILIGHCYIKSAKANQQDPQPTPSFSVCEKYPQSCE